MPQAVIKVGDVIPTREKLGLALMVKEHLEGNDFHDFQNAMIFLNELIASLETDATIEELMGG